MTNIDLSVFKAKFPIQIRFSDFDYLAHVNNANYLTYLEEARIRYFAEAISAGEVDWQRDGIILARAEVDFRKPITGYTNYFIYLRCSRIGTKSFDFSYVMTKEEGIAVEVIAEAKTVMVCFDYDRNETVVMRKEWKDKVIAFEPAL